MEKTCRQCTRKFVIPAEDLEFYKSIAVKIGGKTLEMPAPSLCFACRHQKRLAFRNEMNLYHRKCDKTGKQIISMYSPDKPYKIFDQHVWWSDDWDPMEYGKDFDFNRPFFEQFKELQLQVPRMSLNNITPENSDYCNLSLGDRNCYLVFTADENENCAYCHKCINSSDLTFCYNMIGCHDCIGSSNLRNKQYYIFNESCRSREDYVRRKAELNLNTYSGMVVFKKKYLEFLAKQPRKYLDIVNCENSVGDNLRDCKNAFYCYNSIGLEDCRYMINCYQAKNCYDWDFVALTGSTHCHEMSSAASNMVNCHFCAGCWEDCSDIYYSELCLHSQNLFGCIGLRHKKYCIFNKQYTKEEYEELVPRIIEYMKKTGEWGEFFPIELSTYAYNETVAAEYFQYTKEQVLKKGWRWIDDDSEKMDKGSECQIADDVKEVDEDICKQILICAESGKPFKIIPQELSFCKMKGFPVPRVSPRQRHKNRMALRNPWALYQRKCSKCEVEITTTYAPTRPEPVYCEKCYADELN